MEDFDWLNLVPTFLNWCKCMTISLLFCYLYSLYAEEILPYITSPTHPPTHTEFLQKKSIEECVLYIKLFHLHILSLWKIWHSSEFSERFTFLHNSLKYIWLYADHCLLLLEGYYWWQQSFCISLCYCLFLYLLVFHKSMQLIIMPTLVF